MNDRVRRELKKRNISIGVYVAVAAAIVVRTKVLNINAEDWLSYVLLSLGAGGVVASGYFHRRAKQLRERGGKEWAT